MQTAESPDEKAANGSAAPVVVVAGTKTKLEKTQSLLTVASTSVGLIGVIGSIFTYAAATFYTGTVEVQPQQDTPGVVVKVYTKEGHESVFHSKHIELMPGDYHLEISAPTGKVVHVETKVAFHKTHKVPVDLGQAPPASAQPAQDGSANIYADVFGTSNIVNKPVEATAQPEPAHKKRWWQFWRHSSEDETKNNDLEKNSDSAKEEETTKQ